MLFHSFVIIIYVRSLAVIFKGGFVLISAFIEEKINFFSAWRDTFFKIIFVDC